MTREEQIKQQALIYSDCSEKWFDEKGYFGDSNPYYEAHSFADGAKWADETMRDKILMWLDSIDFDMRYWNPEEGVCVGDFIEDLRKVMEG